MIILIIDSDTAQIRYVRCRGLWSWTGHVVKKFDFKEASQTKICSTCSVMMNTKII